MYIIIRECWSFHWRSSLPRWCPTPFCYGFHFISRIMVNHMMCEFCNSIPNQLCLCDVSYYMVVKNTVASLKHYTLLHIVYITTEICDNSRFEKIFSTKSSLLTLIDRKPTVCIVRDFDFQRCIIVMAIMYFNEVIMLA